MSRPSKPPVHGKRATYNGGCRCTECKAANTAYALEKRDRDRGLVDVPQTVTRMVPADGARPRKMVPVPDLPPDDEQHEPGEVEAAVIAELSLMTSPERFPAQAAAAIALGRLLDQKRMSAAHPRAAAQLKIALEALWNKSETKAGRLSAVTNMARATSR